MTLPPERRTELIATYRDGLLDDVLPFWLRHAVDREHGGFFTALDRDGSVLDTDKAIWLQGRFVWLLATLHATVEPRDEWLALAADGLAFIERHAFDDDGRMLFLVTRDGRPLRKRRYVFSEAFAAMAYAAYARAAGSERHATRAIELFAQFTRYAFTPGMLPPKVDSATRPAKALGPLMITLNLAQVLRETVDAPDATAWIDRCIDEMRRDFVKPERRAVMEIVTPGGRVIDHFDGRTLNPGHAIEAAWFVLQEARERGGESALVSLGTQMLDWTWERGWDAEHGGLRSFCDLDGKPLQEPTHDMKFWWPQTEAIIATLLAHDLTGDARYATWHTLVHDWAHARFPDAEHGEWFGYLHRDGRLSVPLKANHWKGPFHVPRMQWYCWRLLAGG